MQLEQREKLDLAHQFLASHWQSADLPAADAMVRISKQKDRPAASSEADILEQYPSLTSDDIKACLACAARLMDGKYELARVA